MKILIHPLQITSPQNLVFDAYIDWKYFSKSRRQLQDAFSCSFEEKLTDLLGGYNGFMLLSKTYHCTEQPILDIKALL